MFDWIWVLAAGWFGFIAGFLCCALMRMAGGYLSDEELEAAAKDYYKLKS